jgi:hypothetical protein
MLEIPPTAFTILIPPYYWRGANNITKAPTKQISAPTQSYKSGVFLSTPQYRKNYKYPSIGCISLPSDGMD